MGRMTRGGPFQSNPQLCYSISMRKLSLILFLTIFPLVAQDFPSPSEVVISDCATPEPSAMAMLGIGLAGIVVFKLRKKR